MNAAAVETIMNQFNFNKVHDTMVALDWSWWHCGVPSVEELRKSARQLLTEVQSRANADQEEHWISTGGFKATYSPTTKNLGLEFIVSDAAADGAGNPIW